MQILKAMQFNLDITGIGELILMFTMAGEQRTIQKETDGTQEITDIQTIIDEFTIKMSPTTMPTCTIETWKLTQTG